MTYVIQTGSTAPGSMVGQFEDSGDPQTLANTHAQQRANFSGYASSAVVTDENGNTIAEAWADPENTIG